MSQLQTVLRRSVAHLAPSDHDGRKRMFTSAREAMIRLLWSYDPPLTPSEIDSKIDEFDGVVAEIIREDQSRDRDLAIDDRADDKPSGLVTPEAAGLAAPDAMPFSTTLVLPPREPMRKLARFEPLSQIGSPTPAKGSDAIRIPASAPSADAAMIEALAALDNAAGGKPGVRRDSAILAKLTQGSSSSAAQGKVSEAKGPADDARASELDDEDGYADKDDHKGDEHAKDAPAPGGLDDDLQPDDDVSTDDVILDDEEPDEARDDGDQDELDREDADHEDLGHEDAAHDDPDHDEEPLEDEDEPLDAEALDDETDGDDRDDASFERGGGRESADDILRQHRERFDARAAFKAEPRQTVEDDVEDDIDEEPFDRDELDEDPLDEDEPRRSVGERLRDATRAISGRMIGVIAGVILLLVAGLGGAAFLFSRSPTPATMAAKTQPTAPAPSPPAPPTDIAGVIAAAPDLPAPAAPPATDVAAGALALETLNLFDGRDPSVFQSMPDNPVRFEGDTQGGFARVSSSTNSTGSRITVGRGVYERLAGRTIRLVVVARGSATEPAHTLRFAYQNGRSLSPWKDGDLGKDYAPLSATWTVPKERGGPETDAVLIEPGIPGDGTAVDIKSVRIEVLK